MISKLDFVGIPSQDAERSRTFYVETLGLRPDDQARFEVWAGTTCFGIWEPERLGMPFAPQKNAHPALHVDDVAAARAELEARASSSPARCWTPASATWRSSRTPTATTSCCITATRRARRETRVATGNPAERTTAHDGGDYCLDEPEHWSVTVAAFEQFRRTVAARSCSGASALAAAAR